MSRSISKTNINIADELNTIYLSEKDSDMVVKLLSNPPEPNETLKELFSNKGIIEKFSI